MKKLTTLLILLLLLSGCTNQWIPNQNPDSQKTPNEQKQESPQTPPAVMDVPVKQIVQNFREKLFPERENVKVISLSNKEQLISALSHLADKEVINRYVNYFYKEKRDGLYLISQDPLIMIDSTLPYNTVKDGENHYTISQESESPLYGKYKVNLLVEKKNENWFINDIQINFDNKDVAYLNVTKDLQSILLLVNKTHPLPSGYIPADLVEVQIPYYFKEKSEKKLLREEAAIHLEQLFNKAKEDHIKLLGASGYRSYKTQEAIFAYNVTRYGSETEANRVSAHPGQSEHQTGLTIDLTSDTVNDHLLESFGETTEGIWLKENASHFGFIIRYPKGTEAITGYSYEPWHIRYVGRIAAEEIAKQGITYEEYLKEYHYIQ